MRVGKGAVAAGVASLLVVGALVWSLKQDKFSDQPLAAGRATEAGFKADGSSAVSSGGAGMTGKLPLPPLDIAVTDMFDDLKRRADQGDSLASCRLAVELINCTQIESLAQVGHMERSKWAEVALEKSGELAAANSLASQQMKQLEVLKRCTGISEGQRKLAGPYLLQAARAGIPEAMIRYAEGQSITTGNSMFGALQDEGFDHWRSNAVGLLEKALEHGEPSAVYVLYVAYSDDNTLIGGLIADDPVKFYSYRLLMSRLRGKDDAPVGKLSSQQVTEARRNVSRMHAEFFNNRILREPDAFTSLMTPAWALPEGTDPRRPCE